MADINPTLPSVNELNSTADPKVLSALQTIVSTVNDLETANLADSAVTSAKIADGTVATADIANGAITSAKLASGVGGTALVVGSVTATTERTTTSTTLVDVTSASFSLTIASNSVTLVLVSCELRATNPYGDVTASVNAIAGSGGALFSLTSDGASTIYPSIVQSVGSTYKKINGSSAIHSSQSGTGAQTIKAQFLAQAFCTSYIKNVYLSAVNIPL